MTTIHDHHRRRVRRRLPAPGPQLAEGRTSRRPSAAAPLRAAVSEEEELAEIAARARQLQRMLFDGGFAGVCFPKEYGGLGLTPEHQRALNEESRPATTIPCLIQVPTFVPCMAVLLEFGTEEQKLTHIPADAEGRGDLDAVPLRAQRWLGRRRRAHHRGARRRRVGRERLEGVDDRRVVLRLRPVPAAHELGRAQAPRAQRVHHPDPPARHRAAPDRDDQRLQGVLPGVHHRPARARLRPGR